MNVFETGCRGRIMFEDANERRRQGFYESLTSQDSEKNVTLEDVYRVKKDDEINGNQNNFSQLSSLKTHFLLLAGYCNAF